VLLAHILLVETLLIVSTAQPTVQAAIVLHALLALQTTPFSIIPAPFVLLEIANIVPLLTFALNALVISVF
jgi:hypothetical protein